MEQQNQEKQQAQQTSSILQDTGADKAKKKKKRRKTLIWAAGIVVVAVVALLLIFGGPKAVSFHTAAISRGEVEITVMATGYVQPVEEVEVGTQVSGVIEEIYVDYNSHVKQGQLLARLETYTLEEKVNQAKSSLRSSQSDLDYARQNYDRVKRLYEGAAATQVSYEEAVNRLSQAETALENAKSTLSQAELNLSYAYIYSPIDGVVLERAVNSGQTVAASFNTPTLFTIAEDLQKMQVEADVDEADIGQVREGQAVTFTVDSYPDEQFSGTVIQIRLQPTVTSNVVTYTVIVEAPNPEEKLFPGMTANITITVKSAEGLLVPVEALNFKAQEHVGQHYNLKPAGQHEGRSAWAVGDGFLEEKPVRLGIGDGIYYIAESGLSECDRVALSATVGRAKKEKNGVSLMPSPPRGGGGGPR